MRQLNFLKAGELEWREVPEPKLQEPTDALVRPIAVTMCDGDIAALRGTFPVSGPFPAGHEFVAEVIETGDELSAFKRGQLVVLPVQISCGNCVRCERGQTAGCKGVRQPAAWGLGALGGNWPGAFCDVLRVPFANHMMVPVPEDLPVEAVVSAGDNLTDAWRTVAPHLAELPGAKVLVMGNGSIGLFAVMIAVALGASRVHYVDDDKPRLSLADSLGATAFSRDGRHTGAYDIVVEANLGNSDLPLAVRSIAFGGVCTVVFAGFGEAKLPIYEMWLRSVRFHTGVANCRANMPAVLDLVASGRIHPELVLTEKIPWDDADRALAKPSMKPVFFRAPISS